MGCCESIEVRNISIQLTRIDKKMTENNALIKALVEQLSPVKPVKDPMTYTVSFADRRKMMDADKFKTQLE